MIVTTALTYNYNYEKPLRDRPRVTIRSVDRELNIVHIVQSDVTASFTKILGEAVTVNPFQEKGEGDYFQSYDMPII